MSTSFGANQIRIPLRYNVLTAAISTFGTWLFLMLGAGLTSYFPHWLPGAMGSILLLLIGIFVLADFLFCPGQTNSNRELTIKSVSIMAAALTINNAGIGFAAGMAGFNILLTATMTFVMTILCILLGNTLGKTVLQKLFGKYSGLICSLLLIALGIYELL